MLTRNGHATNDIGVLINAARNGVSLSIKTAGLEASPVDFWSSKFRSTMKMLGSWSHRGGLKGFG